MKVDYVSRGYELDERIRDYTEDKLNKALKFLDDPVDVRVTLEMSKHRQIAELHVSHRFGTFLADEDTGDMLDSVNLAVDKIEKQARRARKKFVDKRRKADRLNGHQWPMEILEAESLKSGQTPRIIKSTRLQIKPMAVEEAALVLEESQREFVVFRDASSNRIHVLYKRRDNNYGLIAPE